MSVINSQPLIGASGNQSTAYNLTRSLRFRSSASAYLSRTPASAGNRKTWTWSAWVKRGTLSSRQCLLQIETAFNDNQVFAIELRASDAFGISAYSQMWRESTQVLRDPSAWYHLMVVVDTTLATANDRIKMYVNGSQITSFSAINNPSQNADLGVNQAGSHAIGRNNNNSLYFDGYLAEINFIDGQALEPSSFGETDTATGVWKPKKYTGTYGTNGFYLKFDNLTSTSTLGNDSSGNSNTWTVNNISLTSGVTYDSMKDVPTLTDADTANYCTLNPLTKYSNTNPLNGNLNITTPSGDSLIGSTIGMSSGKWYAEAVMTAGNMSVGVYNQSGLSAPNGTKSRIYFSSTGNKFSNGSSSAYGNSYTNGDVIGVAIDMDNGKIFFSKNNTWQASGDPVAGTNAAFTDLANDTWFVTLQGGQGTEASINFGQRPFAYTPPSGFKALNTFNLPTPTIGATATTQANDYFDVATYAGDGTSTRTITTSPNFTPDLYWLKNRTDGFSHLLYDRVRGAGENADLASNTTAAEGDNNTNSTFGFVSAFTNDGITVVKGSNSVGYTNTSGHNYVVWQWRASGSTVSNTAGTITSTVSANTSAGFSIVTFNSGSSGNKTVGHGLGVTPAMLILKDRVNSGTSWQVWHQSLSNQAQSYLNLHNTNAATNDSRIWANTAPTSTVFSFESGYGFLANSNIVAYCFAEVAGYSRFGSYTGNGSTDGTFVYTGFRPRYLMVKRTDSTGEWDIVDAARNTSNVLDKVLLAHDAAAEATYAWVDFTSNGFKLRNTSTNMNGNGATYIYMAVAENPFKYSLAR